MPKNQNMADISLRKQLSVLLQSRNMEVTTEEKWKTTALLVIDMQKDFIVPNGLLRVDGGEAIVPSVIKAVDVARQRGIPVIWVVREHDALGRDVELFRRHLYGCEKTGPTTKGREGADLVDGLVIKEGDYKLVKTRFSAFSSTHLHSYLQGVGINSIVVVGVQTPNCIRQTVYDAVALDYQSVTVIVDATAAATPEVHEVSPEVGLVVIGLVSQDQEKSQGLGRYPVAYCHALGVRTQAVGFKSCLHWERGGSKGLKGIEL
ncbi:hypothetical protein IFM89_019374 [Coptis chinensis]|uniref:Isochorismatase-like domain-containing protein n=1 Tax=Coptis chinensis TaxID=261450 RepID=A0A835M8I0_9MAGN|nr:hypothetical protein IFM89_019374 [Coptis chinensis]